MVRNYLLILPSKKTDILNEFKLYNFAFRMQLAIEKDTKKIKL